MKHIRYDQPVTGDALILGARLPRRDEVPAQPPAPAEVAPGVFVAPDGKFFTSLETPKGVSPEASAERVLAKNRQFATMYGKRVHDSIIMDELTHDDDLLQEVMRSDIRPHGKAWVNRIYGEFFRGNFATEATKPAATETACADFNKLEKRIAEVVAAQRSFGDAARAVEGEPFDRYGDCEMKHAGTTTGRMSSGETIFQELPKARQTAKLGDIYSGKEVRSGLVSLPLALQLVDCGGGMFVCLERKVSP